MLKAVRHDIAYAIPVQGVRRGDDNEGKTI